MTSNVKACTPSEINCYPMNGLHWPKHAKTLSHFFKTMVVNRYACHVESIFNCMPTNYIHIMYCYKTFHYKRYTKYILLITMLPYRITPNHVITLTVSVPTWKD
jgi:hypothetical protein